MHAARKAKLTSSLEDYLEAILLLVRENRVARVRDIAKHLGVGMPSVTSALKGLAKRKLVNYDPYQVVTLTDRGREVAGEISGRHVALRRFFADVLGLDSETADANACRMEHAVDNALFERLTRFAEFIRSRPQAGHDWIEEFREFCQQGPDISPRQQSLGEALEALDESKGLKAGRDGADGTGSPAVD